VALWLTAHTRRRALSGFVSQDGWGRAAEIIESPWTDDGKARFAPLNQLIPVKDRSDVKRNAWTFSQAAAAVRTHLAEDGIAVRIAGPSGFGKSRFAYEVFNRSPELADEIESACLIHADLSITGDEVTKLALEIAEAGAPTILVVDECPDEVHHKIVAVARRAGSRLRLVTIDVETRVVAAPETLTIGLDPAADEQIGAIAKAISPTLDASDLRFIEQLSSGFPQMAVLAARQKARGRQTILSIEQILDRIIWGRKIPNEDAQKALECASLFEWIELSERVGDHASYIATELAGMSEDRFVEYLKTFNTRGIIVQRGDYLQVGPPPLATRLAARRLSLFPNGRLIAVFAEAPLALRKWLLGRMRWLDSAPEVRSFAEALLAPLSMGNFDALNTDFGALCLDRLVHVDPDLAMSTIDRVFGTLTVEQLTQFQDGRRHLVWALEKLAFRKESFEDAATLLRRLGAAETEGRISNNASGQFKQLFQLYLSGTEAAPTTRLAVLDDGLASSHSAERELCIEALDRMLLYAWLYPWGWRRRNWKRRTSPRLGTNNVWTGSGLCSRSAQAAHYDSDI